MIPNDPTQTSPTDTQQPQAPAVNDVAPQPQNPNISPVAPVTPTLAPQASPTPPHHNPLGGIMDSILKRSTGGDVYVTNPDGTRTLAPQSRGTLGRTLIAATLAGLLSKDEYRQTPYGDVRNFAGSAANAAEASQNVVGQMRAKPQQVSDNQEAAKTRQLMTLQANANLHKTMIASAMQDHKALVDLIESSKPLLNDVNEYETNRTSGQDTARLGQHLSLKDAQAKLTGAYLKWTALPDGTESVLNPVTGKVEDNPTYTVVNPNAKVKLSSEAADVFALTNPAYDNLHGVVGGDVTVPLSLAI